MHRKISATMATQHPDHAGKPYWHHSAFITTKEETEECFRAFSELGISEYKWDWEGKFVDEAVMERLIGEHLDYFTKHPLGKDKFLTFRLPNPKVETEFRMGRAFMGILSAASLAKQVGLYSPPLFEVILPMTESASEMLDIQEAFHELATLKHPLYRFENDTLKFIEIIPLFEQVSTTIRSADILREYIGRFEKIFHTRPSYLRPYVARSDPALNSGIIPTVLGIKLALSSYKDFEEETGITLYPIIGPAALPFRGGIRPDTVEQFANEYKGIRTTIIQSAFRYDFDKELVKKAIIRLEELLSKGRIVQIPDSERKKLLAIIALSEPFYKNTIEHVAPIINKVAVCIPKRRERVQHIGLFGYSRGVGKIKLPRAISFTASLYSIGIPPELIGTGRALREIEKKGDRNILEKHYLNITSDLTKAGRFLNKKVLHDLAKQHNVYAGIEDDVKGIEEYFGQELGPQTSEEKKHYALVEEIYHEIEKNNCPTDLIERAAVLRKSLG